jgi:hypothetical protein
VILGSWVLRRYEAATMDLIHPCVRGSREGTRTCYLFGLLLLYVLLGTVSSRTAFMYDPPVRIKSLGASWSTIVWVGCVELARVWFGGTLRTEEDWVMHTNATDGRPLANRWSNRCSYCSSKSMIFPLGPRTHPLPTFLCPPIIAHALEIEGNPQGTRSTENEKTVVGNNEKESK